MLFLRLVAMTTTIQPPGFLTFTISIVCVLFGCRLNHWIAPLRSWNIPEAVTGGLLAAVLTLVAYRAFGLAITFDLGARDMLLVSAFFIDLANALVIGLFVR